ncbi:Rv0909 family putative TA system antitoxin [Cumulibacter manganitolerans]|uniref:Rv0909 family putative TA system antitoxin n=1 Tax=Cumulibacter manganitolerans TaxID=1884992 RepID=UPI001296F563|nr:Rv0909 family putative TA system antitoxin [Cumulibacter manganitolerans]
MGLDDMIGKGKDALSKATHDEQQSDALLDKGERLADDRFAGHDEQIAKGRDALDDRLGDGQ